MSNDGLALAAVDSFLNGPAAGLRVTALNTLSMRRYLIQSSVAGALILSHTDAFPSQDAAELYDAAGNLVDYVQSSEMALPQNRAPAIGQAVARAEFLHGEQPSDDVQPFISSLAS